MRLPSRAFPLLLLALYGAALLLTQPAVINGDGVGYLKQVEGDTLAPGHLAYLPLLRTIAGMKPDRSALQLVLPLRLLSIASSLLALVLLYDACRRLHGSRRGALLATALLGLGHAFSRSATEVEVYAPATLLAVATLWALARHRARPHPGWAGATGLLAGAATLMHLTLALLVVPLLLLARPRDAGRPLRWSHLVAGLAAMGLSAGVPLALILANRGLTAPSAAWAWLRSADHGIADPHGWTAPLVALWGLARSLMHVPYPYESSLALVIPQSIIAGLALLVLALWGHRNRAALDLPLLALWSGPLAAFAVAFFPSDTERWIFVLPAVSLCLAPLARTVPTRWATGLLMTMALVNLLLARLPAALDRGPLLQARSAERVIDRGALLVSPGHGWDELVGLGTTAPPEHFPLIYHVGAEGGIEPAIRLLHRRIRGSLAAGRAVYVARLGDRSDPRGFKELAWFGLDRNGFGRLFHRYRLTPGGAPGLWRLYGASKAPTLGGAP